MTRRSSVTGTEQKSRVAPNCRNPDADRVLRPCGICPQWSEMRQKRSFTVGRKHDIQGTFESPLSGRQAKTVPDP